MSFGALQRSKSYRQLWVRSATRTAPLGRGPASLVLGSDATDETATLQAGDRIEVGTTGDVNDAKRLELRGAVRLNAPPPEGYGWRLTISVDSVDYEVDFTETYYGDVNPAAEHELDDLAFNITGAGNGVPVDFALELIEDPDNAGGTGVDVGVTLPSVYFDQLLAPETTASELYVANREPAPGARNVPNDLPTIEFTLADTNGAGVDLSATTATVDGVTAYTSGAFVGPWSGTATTGTGPTSSDVRFVMTVPAANLPYGSEQNVEVNVVSELSGSVSPIDVSWVFTAADTVAPAIQRATMVNKTTLRVTFTDDVRLDSTPGGALNPASYSIIRLSSPAATLQVTGVSTVLDKTDTVDLTFDIEASFGAEYAVRVSDVEDDAGNEVDPQGRELRFTGFVPPAPAGRRFELLDFLPDLNIADDRTAAQGGCATEAGSGDLRKFVLVLQDVVNLLLCQVDRWTDIIDPDLAPEPFLDAMLQDLGNPFEACISDLTVIEKRRLARVLISIYKQKGTEPGLINAVRFFTGIEVTLDIVNCRQFWQLDVSLLGVNTYLAPGQGSPLWYSFAIVSPVVLTEDQRQRILCIADYMKPTHEHILGVTEPGAGGGATAYWTLNVSLLGNNTTLAT